MELTNEYRYDSGEGTELRGQFKQATGDATANLKLQQDGVVDQLSGRTTQGFATLRDFVRDQPILASTIGALALALLGRLGCRRNQFGNNEAVR